MGEGQGQVLPKSVGRSELPYKSATSLHVEPCVMLDGHVWECSGNVMFLLFDSIWAVPVSPADPVPEPEDVVGVDAEVGAQGHGRRRRHHVLLDDGLRRRALVGRQRSRGYKGAREAKGATGLGYRGVDLCPHVAQAELSRRHQLS